MSKLSKRAISTLVIALFLLSTITAILPLSYATHTSTATVEFTSGASKVVGEDSSLDVEVTNVGPDPIETVVIDFTGTGFTVTGAGTGPGSWSGVIAPADVVTYTGGTIVVGTPVTFVPEVTNPSSAGLAANPVVTTSDPIAHKATLTTGSAASMNDITYVADLAGVAGNGISIAYTEADPDSVLTVTEVASAISVEMADTGGTIDSTAADVVAAITAHGGASALVDASTTTGSGLMELGVGSPWFLTGGSDATTDYPTTVTGTLVIESAGTALLSIDLVTDTDYVPTSSGQYDDTIIVQGSGVTSGAVVNLYWDYVNAAGLVNNTEAKPSGDYEVWFDVPEAVYGDHYLWVKDVGTGGTASFGPFTVGAKITLSPSSGLLDDKITINGYGFSDDADVTTIFWDAESVNIVTLSPSTPVTNELGSWIATFKVPTDTAGPHTVTAEDDETVSAPPADFKVGASISLSPSSGPVGSIVEISGRGFGTGIVVDGDVTFGGASCKLTEGDTIVDGEFKVEIVIPQVDDVGDFVILVREVGYGTAEKKFEVTGIAEIETEYAFGVQGTTIGIEGWNFTRKSGEEVLLKLYDGTTFVVDIDDFETDSRGCFSGTFQVPARSSAKYSLKASQATYNIEAKTGFRIGLMLILIYPTEGPTGTKVVLTGMGFSSGGYWNATFGGVSIIEDGRIDEDSNLGIGLLGDIPTFIVPTLDVGQYTLVVNDITDEDSIITVSIEFMVTETTTLVTDPLVAPNEYDVKIKGKYFSAEVETDVDVDFIIYNVTADGKVDKDWDMVVGHVHTDKNGNFTALWKVPDNEIMSVGDYTINATDDDGLFAQYLFSVVEKTVEIEPRKPSFAMGETVYFDIESSFAMDPSYIEIYDPYDELYWRTDDFVDEDWLKVGTIERVPYYQQTAGGNPMTLMDATVGPWFWEMFYDDEAVCNGTFEVTPARADILTERINELSGELAIIADGISDVTGEIEDNIDALAGDIADVGDDVVGMKDDIADLAEDVAEAVGAAADTAESLSDLEDDMGDIVDITSDLASGIADALQESTAAKEAAEDSQEGTQGLTTIVYGAIACSLIAALAAIVSLMQISKKIA